jgi:hypothetical protein
MPVTGDKSARGALQHAMVTVGQINQVSTQARAHVTMAAARPIDDLLAKISEWVDRLATALTRIVKHLLNATAFSIEVGSAVTVGVTFGPFGPEGAFAPS